MDFNGLLKEKGIKAKQKTVILSQWLLDNTDSAKALIDFARSAKDADKATCIEAFEFATRNNPALGTLACFELAVESLASTAPRVKWESAKVIAHIASQHSGQLEKAISLLLENTQHEGTVVRWSAALALGEILKLKTAHNAELLPAMESICENETENSIRKIYLAAQKSLAKAKK